MLQSGLGCSTLKEQKNSKKYKFQTFTKKNFQKIFFSKKVSKIFFQKTEHPNLETGIKTWGCLAAQPGSGFPLSICFSSFRSRILTHPNACRDRS